MKNDNKRGAAGVAVFFWLVSFSAWANTATTEAYEKTIVEVVAGFNERSPEAFNRAVDAERILEVAFDGLLLDPAWESSVRKSLNKAIVTQLGQKLVNQMPDGAYARLLRIKGDGEKRLALVRLDFGDTGNGYMDMHLVQDTYGKVRIGDWFDYSTGQRYTQSLRQLIATLSPTPTVLGKVFDLVSQRKDAAIKLSELVKLNNEGKYAEVVHKFLAMDEGMRKSRLLNIIAVQASNSSGDLELYRKALGNLEQFYGNDGTMAYLLLDFHYLEGNYDKVLKAVALVEKSFGVEEAGLVVIRANTLVEQGNYAEAVAQARRAIELEAEYDYGYWSLLTAQVLQEHFDEAVGTATVLQERFGYDMSPASLGNMAIYTTLLESDAYRNWRGE